MLLIHLIMACSLLSITPFKGCREIEDSDKRGFRDLSPIIVDVDGDGKPDTITPRTYAVRINRKPHGKARRKPREANWIAFDLKTSKGRVLRSFFKYQYGTDEADYWVYALVPCEFNKDGRKDFIFYTGDDTSDETIVLLNRGGSFIVHSR